MCSPRQYSIIYYTSIKHKRLGGGREDGDRGEGRVGGTTQIELFDEVDDLEVGGEEEGRRRGNTELEVATINSAAAY